MNVQGQGNLRFQQSPDAGRQSRGARPNIFLSLQNGEWTNAEGKQDLIRRIETALQQIVSLHS